MFDIGHSYPKSDTILITLPHSIFFIDAPSPSLLTTVEYVYVLFVSSLKALAK